MGILILSDAVYVRETAKVSPVHVDVIYVTWVGRRNEAESYQFETTLAAGTTFNYTSQYNAESYQYTIDSVTTNTSGFVVADTSPHVPFTIFIGTNAQFVIYLKCPTKTYSGNVEIVIKNS